MLQDNSVNEIEEIDLYDMATYTRRDGGRSREIPEATSENIEILVSKINELIKEMNLLKTQ